MVGVYYSGDMYSNGSATSYSFTNCKFDNNLKKLTKYDIAGEEGLTMTFTDCDIGNSILINENYITCFFRRRPEVKSRGSSLFHL